MDKLLNTISKIDKSEDQSISEDKITELLSVIDEVPGNIYWKDLDGRYLGCNTNVVKSFNKVRLNKNFKSLTRDDVIGRTNYELFNYGLAEKLTCNDNLVINTCEEQVFVESHIPVDGNEIFYLSRKAPYFDKNGKVIGIIGSAHEITKQKQLEVELEEALQKSRADIKAKDAFIDNLSHDIRTPLTGIIGLVDHLIKKTEDNKEVNKKTILLKNSVTSFLNFFNDILESVEDIDINENEEYLMDIHSVISEFEKIYGPAVTDKNLKFNVIIDKNVSPFILAKKNIVVRIITNLIGNAIKFTNKGKVELHINNSSSPGYLEIKVIDTGIGISKSNIDKIFDRFSRLNANNGKYKGTGLGLFMVAKYVDYISGTISVDSKLGKGSTFKVNFPVKFVEKGYNAVSISNTLKVSKEEYLSCKALPKSNILIIEDNSLAAFALSNLINEFYHDVSVAETGQKALIELKDKNFDMIFLDQDLPDANGLELLDLIRSIEHCKTTPILILSGHIRKSLQSKLRKLPCEGLFVKPMHRDQLIKIFNKFLGSKEAI